MSESDDDENIPEGFANLAEIMFGSLIAMQRNRERERDPTIFAVKRINGSFEKLANSIHQTLSDVLEYLPLLEEGLQTITNEEDKKALLEYMKEIEKFNHIFMPYVADQVPNILGSGKNTIIALGPNFEKFLKANVEYIKNIKVCDSKEGESVCSICTCEDKKMGLIKRCCDDCEGHECNEERSNICLECLLHSFWEDTHATDKTEEKTHSKCPFCKAEYCKKDIYICKNTENL